MNLQRLSLGCAAGLALGAAASWARLAADGTTRVDTHTTAFVAASLFLGVGLALSGRCALRLTRVAGSIRPRALLGWATLVHLVAALACALTSRDLYSNLAYGQLQLLGKNPYLVGPRALGPTPLLDLVGSRWLDTTSAYGPIISAVSRLAAMIGSAVGSPIWGAAAAFKLAMLLCSLGTVVLAQAHARRIPAPDGAEGVALVALSPLLAWEVSAQAHNDGVLVLALMAFVWASGRGRELLAVLALTAGVMAKLAAAPLLALYLLVLLRRPPARAIALGGVALGLGALLLAPYWAGTAVLQGPGAALGGDAARHAHSLADLLCIVLEPVSARAATAAYRLCWIASTALCLALFVRGARRATSVDDVVHHGLVLVFAYCLTAPWFHPWYATWLLPLAAAERDPGLRRLVAAYAVLTVVQWALPLDPVTNVAVNCWAALTWRRLAGGSLTEALR